MPSTLGIVASGEDVLNDAVFWVDAGRSSIVTDSLTNLGTGGSALNARFGSTTSSDAFDPLILTHTGTNYLYLPGIAGNTISCTAPAAATSFAATPLGGGADTTGAVTGGALFAFSTVGSWSRVRLLDGALTIVADFTVNSGSQTGLTDAYGVVWTINRATSGRKSVAVVRPVLLFGTDDYLEVADNDLLDFGASQDMTLLWIGRQWGNTAGMFRAMLAKMSSIGFAPGWCIIGSSFEGLVQYRTRDASTQVAPTSLSITAGANAAAFAVRQGTSHRLTVSNNGTSSTNAIVATALDTTNTTAVRIGANVTGGQLWEGELVAAAVWRRALNANEIATIVNRYT